MSINGKLLKLLEIINDYHRKGCKSKKENKRVKAEIEMGILETVLQFSIKSFQNDLKYILKNYSKFPRESQVLIDEALNTETLLPYYHNENMVDLADGIKIVRTRYGIGLPRNENSYKYPINANFMPFMDFNFSPATIYRREEEVRRALSKYFFLTSPATKSHNYAKKLKSN